MWLNEPTVSMNSAQPRFRYRLRTPLVVTAIASFLLAGYVLWNGAMEHAISAVLVGEVR